jgi:hypothetical protein
VSLSSAEDLLKGVDLGSQESVKKLAVSIQERQRREESVNSQLSQLSAFRTDTVKEERREPRTAQRQDIRWSELIVKERL